VVEVGGSPNGLVRCSTDIERCGIPKESMMLPRAIRSARFTPAHSTGAGGGDRVRGQYRFIP